MKLRFFITLASVFWLAWAAQHTLPGLLEAFANRQPATFRIEVLQAGGTGSSDSQELRFAALIGDGRSMRLNTVRDSSGWAVLDGSGLPPQLAYKQDSRPSVVTFQAKRFVAALDAYNWRGVVRTIRNEQTTQSVDVAVSGQRKILVTSEDQYPTKRRSLAEFVVMLLIFGGCAYLFGAWREDGRIKGWIAFFLATLHLMYWSSQTIGTTNDTAEYASCIQAFRSGVCYFPPGYPAFLAGMESFGTNQWGSWTTLVQHAMAVLAGIWFYGILRRIVSVDFALLGAILLGILAPSFTVPQAVISEMVTQFAMVGAIYFSMRSFEVGGLRQAVAAGLLAGWAAASRAVPLAALVPSMCVLQWFSPATDKVRRIALTLALTSAVLILPMLSGYTTNSLGFHLYNRVVTEQKLLDEQGAATRPLLNSMQEDPRQLAHWDVRSKSYLREFDYNTQESTLRKVSLEAIRKAPWKYALYTPGLAWRMLIAPTGWIPYWGDTIMFDAGFEEGPLLPYTASAFRWRLTLEEINIELWPVICWLAVVGFALAPWSGRWLAILAVAWIPFAHLILSAAVEYFSPRYNAPVIPFVVALAMVPFDIVYRAIEARFTRHDAVIDSRP